MSAERLTDAELKAAGEELAGAAGRPLEGNPFDRFLNVVIEHDSWEAQRLSAQERYVLSSELPIDRSQTVREYAAAKKAVLVVERRLAALLVEMSEQERATVLAGARFWVERPGIARLVFVKPELAERLSAGLRSRDRATED